MTYSSFLSTATVAAILASVALLALVSALTLEPPWIGKHDAPEWRSWFVWWPSGAIWVGVAITIFVIRSTI
jgi:hypothetical protein